MVQERILNKNWLIEQYTNKNRSLTDIAKELETDYRWLSKKMKNMGIPLKANGMMVEMIGKKFGKLTCLERINEPNNNKKHAIYYKFLCDCGNEFKANGRNVRSGATTRCSKCTISKEEHVQWSGCGEISGSWWGQRVKRRNAKTGIELSISIEYAWDLFLKQNRKCKLSGQDLYFQQDSKSANGTKSGGTASLDRIDSTKGYIEGNVQWVHKDINIAKMNKTDEQFIKMCLLVVKHNKLL